MMNRITKLLRRLNGRLPWNRWTLADLPEDERRRVKAMMLGAGAGLRPRPGEKTIRIEVETTEERQ